MKTLTWASDSATDWANSGIWSPADPLFAINTGLVSAGNSTDIITQTAAESVAIASVGAGATTAAAGDALTTTGSVGVTNLNVTLSGSLQGELGNTGVYAYSVWYDDDNTIGTWNTLVYNGTIETSGTVAIPLPNTSDAADQTNGGRVYFIIQSADTSQAYVPIQNEITSQSEINWSNADTYDFRYDIFEVSLLSTSSDAGDLSSVDGFGLPMGVSVPYVNITNNITNTVTNGMTQSVTASPIITMSTATVGYGISGATLVSDIQNIHSSDTTIYNFATGTPLSGDFRMALSPSQAVTPGQSLTPTVPFSTSDWNPYVDSLEGPNALDIVLSGEFNGAADANGIWHNGGYYAYQAQWDPTFSPDGTLTPTFWLVPLPSSQIKGAIQITPAALENSIYSQLGTVEIYSSPNGTLYAAGGPGEGLNNQWDAVLAQFFTGFTGGFYGESGKSPNPQVTGTIDLNENINWDPIYAFGKNLASTPPTGYQTSDPYSEIFYDNSNSYGSPYSDNLMKEYPVGGPLIPVSQGTITTTTTIKSSGTTITSTVAPSNVPAINLTIFADGETPTGFYTQPTIYNYITPDVATGFLPPNDTNTTDSVTLDFGSSVNLNAGVVLPQDGTITLNILTSDTGTVPVWDTVTFDGATAGTSGLWQQWDIGGSPGNYSAEPMGTSAGGSGFLQISTNSNGKGFPVADTGISWYQISVGDKTFNLYTTTLDGAFENPNYAGQQGALAIDGLATVTPAASTSQTVNAITVNIAPNIDPSLLIPNTASVTTADLSIPDAPVAGTISGTFAALAGQTMQVSNTITTQNPDLAFAWTGENSDPNVVSWISGYTNKINGGDVALVTIVSAAGTITTPGTADIDGQWQTGTVDLGNGTYTVTMQEFTPSDTAYAASLTKQSQPLVLTVTCFVAGTRIMTERGEVAVEALREGDRVQLVVGSAREIRWIGQRTVDCMRHPEPCNVWPVRVRAGAFGPGQPARDLHLSPDHAVYVMNVLIPVKYLIDGNSVVQMPVNKVAYYHVELPEHSVLLAEGLPVESYLDTGDRSNFANDAGPMRLLPDFSTRSLDIAYRWDAEGCAPLVITGPKLDAVRHWLNALAGDTKRTATAARRTRKSVRAA